jgi:hypothetical protein
LRVALTAEESEKRMARRRWKWLVIGPIALALLIWGYDRVMTIYWVGSTDLEVEFAITDNAAGSPIADARVEIQQSKGGFYEDRDEKEFVLISDSAGLARRGCPESMCFGTRSGLGFTNTFAVHLPYWQFRIVADGYQPGQWTPLNVQQYIREAQRAGPGKAKLRVPMSLHKSQAFPDGRPSLQSSSFHAAHFAV